MGDLFISKMPDRKGEYLCIMQGNCVVPIARFIRDRSELFREWVQENEGRRLKWDGDE